MCSEVFNFLLIFRRDGVGNKPERREADVGMARGVARIGERGLRTGS